MGVWAGGIRHCIQVNKDILNFHFQFSFLDSLYSNPNAARLLRFIAKVAFVYFLKIKTVGTKLCGRRVRS